MSIVTVAGLTLAGTAAAHDGHHGHDHNQIDGVRVEAHGTVSPYQVLGLGARLEFPIVPDGLIGEHVHDEIALSLGADAFFAELDPRFYNGGLYVVPIAALQWNFYIGHSDWSIFPEAGLAFHIHPDGVGWNGREAVYVEPDLGFGVRYHFASRNALLLRASTPGGLQLGLTF